MIIVYYIDNKLTHNADLHMSFLLEAVRKLMKHIHMIAAVREIMERALEALQFRLTRLRRLPRDTSEVLKY
jgi:tRNA U38,U39,U40 pseudouridine synthase TruA